MNSAINKLRLNVVAHGARLNRHAAAQTSDVNAAHLLVHNVLAGSMHEGASPVLKQVLDAELTRALARLAASDNARRRAVS